MIVGYCTVTFSIIPILGYIVNAESKVWTINSTTESCNRNELVSRAVGANFSAAIIATCNNLHDYSCEVQYIFTDDGLNGRFNIDKDSPINSSGIKNIYAKGMKVLYTYIKAELPTPRVILNFTIIPPSNKELNFMLNTSILCRGRLAIINFVGCKNHTEFDVRLQISKPVRYLNEGTITCTKGIQGHAVFSNNSEALETQCLDDATWKYASDISCLYPIAAQLRIGGQPYMKTVDLKFNQLSNASNVAFVQCCRSASCVNINRSAVILLQRNMDKFIINSTINLHPNVNLANVSCYFQNRYTNIFIPYLSTSLLNISFGPYPPKGFRSLCYFNDGSIKFYSNPASTKSILSLWQGENVKIPTTITECDEMDYGVVAQLITPNMSITGTGFRLQRNYSGTIEHFNVTPCRSVTTTTQVTGTTSKTISDSTSSQDIHDTNKSTDFTIVAILCSGALLLMVFSLIICCRLRRSSKGKPKPGDGKLENVNPLYDQLHGTTVIPKENDQVNPLYETTDADKSGSDVYSVVIKNEGAEKSTELATSESVTYAVVDRNNKKEKNKKTEAPQKSIKLVTSDVETYAVVDRNNKMAMGAPKSAQSATSVAANYSDINRKNKKVKGAQKSKKPTEPATSHGATSSFVDRNNTRIDGAQKSTESVTSEAATYAVVERKIKKAKGPEKSSESVTSDVETYVVVDRKNKKATGVLKSTGSTIPDVETYAVVDRNKKKATGVGYDDNRRPRKK